MGMQSRDRDTPGKRYNEIGADQKKQNLFSFYEILIKLQVLYVLLFEFYISFQSAILISFDHINFISQTI